MRGGGVTGPLFSSALLGCTCVDSVTTIEFLEKREREERGGGEVEGRRRESRPRVAEEASGRWIQGLAGQTPADTGLYRRRADGQDVYRTFGVCK